MKLKFIGGILCILVLCNCSKSPEQQQLTTNQDKPSLAINSGCYTNPIIGDAGGDPYCFKYSGTYYTYRPDDNQVVYNTSTNLTSWTATATLSNFSVTGGVWAPEVHNISSNLYIVYAKPNGSGRDIMICKLSSPTNAGTNTPVTLVGSGSADVNIDPTVYSNGSNYYLVWKSKLASGGNSRIKIRKLDSSDPTQFASGSSASIIIPDAAGWPLNKEHPTLVSQDYGTSSTRYFLFFDGGQGDTPGYKVCYATASSLLGPYTFKGDLMASDAADNIYSIGGQSIVRDGDNYRWMVYRAKNSTDDGWDGRKVYMDRLFIDATANTATCETTRNNNPYCPNF